MSFILFVKVDFSKKGCAKSKKTPKFGVDAIFKNCKKVF